MRGRYSIIGLKPDLIWRCRGNAAEINRQARYDPEAFEPRAPRVPWTAARADRESRIDLPDELPPMAAGLFGFWATTWSG